MDGCELLHQLVCLLGDSYWAHCGAILMGFSGAEKIAILFTVAARENGPFIGDLPITLVIFHSYVSWPKDDMWVCLKKHSISEHIPNRPLHHHLPYSKGNLEGVPAFPLFQTQPTIISRWLSISLTRMHIPLIHYVSIISHDIHYIFQLQSESHIFVHHGWLATSYKVG